MPALATDLRKQLENVCVQARDMAEAAARSALQKRAVDAAEPFSHFSAAEKELRNRLRARGRQAGDVRHPNKSQAIDQLTQELAYEYWHRMLFARFLADDSLGWVYQFWQSRRKDQVNAAGAKIDATTLSAVTQLFTEHYMVEFLLHNTLGAWWVAKEGIRPRMKHGRNTDGRGRMEHGKHGTLSKTECPYLGG